MSRAKELTRSIGSTLASQAVGVVVSVAFFAYFGRTLPKQEMALFALLGTFLSWIQLVGGLGLATLAIREVPRFVAADQGDEARRLVSSAFVYVTVSGLCVAVGLVLLAPTLSMQIFASEAYAGGLRLLAFVAFVESVAATLALLQWALQRFHISAMCAVVQSVGARALAVIGYVVLGIDGFLLAFAVGAFVVIGIHLWTMQRELSCRILPLREVLRQSRGYIGVDVLRNLLMNLDRPVVGFFLGDVALADYHVAKRLYDFLRQALMAVVSPISAKIAEVRLQGMPALNSYFNRSIYLVAILFVPVGFMLVGMSEPFLRVLAGAKYVSGAIIVSCFGVATVVSCTYLVWYEACYRLLSARMLMAHNSLLAVVTFSLYAVFVPWLGPKGIPLSYAAASVVTIVCTAYILRRRVGLVCRMEGYVRAMLCGGLVLAAIWATSWLGRSNAVFVAMGVAAVMTHGIGLWLLAPPEARVMLKAVLAKLACRRPASG